MFRVPASGIAIAITIGVLSASKVFAQDAETSNTFIRVFGSQPATLLDLGLAKIDAALQNAAWPANVNFATSDLIVRSKRNVVSLGSSFEVDVVEPELCAELWRSMKLVLSQEPIATQEGQESVDACLSYIGYFDPAIPAASIGAAWYLSNELSPCEVTTVSVRLTPRNGGMRMICEAPFLGKSTDLSFRTFE